MHYYKSFFSPRQFKTMHSLNFIVSLKLENDSDGQGTHSGFDKDALGITKENACGALCVKTNYAYFLFQFCDALMVFLFSTAFIFVQKLTWLNSYQLHRIRVKREGNSEESKAKELCRKNIIDNNKIN